MGLWIRRIQTTAVLLALAFAFLATACGGSESSVSPTAPTLATPVQYAFAQINGLVHDTAFRPVAGVHVEILDGSQAGASVVSDVAGRFSFSGGPFASGIRYRATKEGYVGTTLTGPLQFGWPSSSAALVIIMPSVAPPAVIEPGDYNLTLMAASLENVRPPVFGDSACAAFPNDLRTRTYAASVTPALNPPNYTVAVSGPQVSSIGFGIGVAANYLAVDVDEGVFEHFPPFTYLRITFIGGTTLDTSPVAAISMPIDMIFDYCVLNSDMGARYNCQTTPQDQVITRTVCGSKNGRLLLTRR